MPKVYATQELSRFDMDAAKAHGELVYILPKHLPHSDNIPAWAINHAQSVLNDIQPGDFFALTSPNPLLFGICFAIFMENAPDGQVNALRFDKSVGGFNKVKLDFTYPFL